MPSTAHRIDIWRAAKSETEVLEFKAARDNFDSGDLFAYCVAIANEHGGKLLLGIADKPPRPVVGTQAYPNTVKTAEAIFAKLRFRVDVEEVKHPDGRVLVFHIPPRPIGEARHLDGKYLMRSGQSTVPMTPDQLKKIYAEVLNTKKPIAVVALIAITIIFSIIVGVVWIRLRDASRTLQNVDVKSPEPKTPLKTRPRMSQTLREKLQSPTSACTCPERAQTQTAIGPRRPRSSRLRATRARSSCTS